MDEIHSRRIKSAMIVYAIEQALGNFILNNSEFSEDLSENTISDILKREQARGRNISNSDTQLIIESSYLNEIFSFALDITKGSTRYDDLKRLKEFCSYLELFEIRNAISHPNRPFPESYWYRSAAIASDPLIEKLNLYQVTQALHAAISGNISPPPEQWVKNVIWAVKNSLPENFDHEITGLLGRDKQFKELKKVLEVPRNSLIAIVAPGGVGKTALILQFLRDLSLSPETTKYAEAILFCTLKNEKLTADGIEKIDAIQGVEQIKEHVLHDLSVLYEDHEFESFENACDKLSDKKIILCIDNLETLLLNNQREFIEFNQSLPLHWRVIVTSRITVDSATTVVLDALGKKHAMHLARNYFRKRGVSQLIESELETIVSKTNYNPLAIRLTVDLFLRGQDLPSSISQSQKDIAAFSYRNLIDTLLPASIAILEAIFSSGASSRNELAEILTLDNDEVAQSVNELSKTSLIIRSLDDSEQDLFSLSDSIRDLLLVNPKNIEVRKHVSETIRKRRIMLQEHSRSQEQRGVTKFDEDYIPSDTPDGLKMLGVETNKLLRKRQIPVGVLADISNKYRDALSQYSKNYLFNFNYARVLMQLKVDGSALYYLLEAEKLNPKSPMIKLAIAKYHFSNGQYPEAEKYFKELFNEGYGNKENSNEHFSHSVVKGWLQSLLYQGKHDDVIGITEGWQGVVGHRALFGSYRASAYKRSIEHQLNDIDKVESALDKAISVLSEVFKLEGMGTIACAEAFRVIKELHYILQSQSTFSVGFLYRALAFVSDNLFEMLQDNRNYSLDSSEIKDWLKVFYDVDIKNNPVHNLGWYHSEEVNYSLEHINMLERDGYTIVTVYHLPNNEDGVPKYMFAADDKGTQYYLNVNFFKAGWERWSFFDVNTKLAIKTKNNVQTGKTIAANEIVEINKEKAIS
ncbi:TPA: hypothetical protein N3045_003804 [Klebsiella pneumoniae]|nr:hypothetical protein [Klebsiella pneumoniae]HCM6608330.1 hypothetical protein [Klebsiella pneumoniae]